MASTKHDEFARECLHIVMAGLVPAIHDLSRGTKNVDARDKPGHDEFVVLPFPTTIPIIPIWVVSTRSSPARWHHHLRGPAAPADAG
ncbi:hypothetical protein FXB38_34665 [Bradyrhizobium cytisi]|uniref:Uncharacterized protein n=1 Tax=Bradyrhizobium cytisi TaxID=515489 RepID=A0A5S4WFW6_9BRAD|nr:hypothetical protein FXB38_34665 [Bradyrhizobium cytisi]